MSIELTPDEVVQIQNRYRHLVNYESDDPDFPISPLTYKDSNGEYLLNIDAQSGDLETIKLLLRAGVEVNQRGDMGCTALHYAKLKKNEEIADFLVRHGASTDIQNDFGRLSGEQQ